MAPISTRSWAARAFVCALACGPNWVHVAFAATVFLVDSTDDDVDDNPGNGKCHTAAGTCTLRAAIMEANRTPNAGAIITLPAGIYPITIDPHDTDDEDNGDFNLGIPSGYTPGPTTMSGTWTSMS